MTDAWCILRCSNAKTLNLATSLADVGFDAWTPVETIIRGEKKEALRVPLTASFVFSPADRLHDLLIDADAVGPDLHATAHVAHAHSNRRSRSHLVAIHFSPAITGAPPCRLLVEGWARS